MPYSNYHTHTNFSDGGNTPEEMVLAAIQEGCPELGFSDHSYLDFDDTWTMTPESEPAYKAEILRLKEAYKDQISIKLGVELDTYTKDMDLSDYDYVIGAVHCVFKDGHYIPVDLAVEDLLKEIDTLYDGDRYAFIEDYYKEVARVYEKTHCNIVAHFDLCTKFLEKGFEIDISSPRYMQAADAALDALLEQPVIFEVNTGAMSRGYRGEPYPDERILLNLAEAGKPVILSSDSHSVDTITYAFPEAEALTKKYDLTLLSRLNLW